MRKKDSRVRITFAYFAIIFPVLPADFELNDK